MVGDLQKDIYAIPERNAAFEAIIELSNDIQQFAILTKSYNEELSKKNEANINLLKSDFKELAKNMVHNFINYSSLHKTYPNAPYVIACMNIHLSCLAIAGEIPSKIKAILELQYRPWFEQILIEDTSKITLSSIILDLQKKQLSNKLSIYPLYSLIFKIQTYEKILNQYGDWGMDQQIIEGEVKKIDYSLTKIFDDKKLSELQPLVERNIISQSDFPELIVEKLLETEKFPGDLIKDLGTNESIKNYIFKVYLPVKLESSEIKIILSPYEIYQICENKLNYESKPYPQYIPTLISKTQKDINEIGESIIRHGNIKYNCQLSIEKIDEMIQTIDTLH